MATQTEEERMAEYLARQKEQLAAAQARLGSLLNRPALKERLYEAVGSPRVLVRIFDDPQRRYFCVVECEGLAPYRTTTAEERVLGILLLAPPAVEARTAMKLVDLASRALQTAISSTPGAGLDVDAKGRLSWSASLTAGDLAMIHYRTARAVRQTLRLMGEEI